MLHENAKLCVIFHLGLCSRKMILVYVSLFMFITYFSFHEYIWILLHANFHPLRFFILGTTPHLWMPSVRPFFFLILTIEQEKSIKEMLNFHFRMIYYLIVCFKYHYIVACHSLSIQNMTPISYTSRVIYTTKFAYNDGFKK